MLGFARSDPEDSLILELGFLGGEGVLGRSLATRIERPSLDPCGNGKTTSFPSRIEMRIYQYPISRSKQSSSLAPGHRSAFVMCLCALNHGTLAPDDVFKVVDICTSWPAFVACAASNGGGSTPPSTPRLMRTGQNLRVWHRKKTWLKHVHAVTTLLFGYWF